MRQRSILGSILVLVTTCQLFPAGAAPSQEPQVRSPLAVVDSVKAQSLAAKAGLKPGDLITTLNGNASPSLETLFAHRFEREMAQDAILGLASGQRIHLPQGEWGCEFRPDLTGPMLARLQEARTVLEQPAQWNRGLDLWTRLAKDLARQGSPEAATCLGLELSGALLSSRHFPEAQQTLKAWRARTRPGSFWHFATLLEEARALRADGKPDPALGILRQAQAQARQVGSESWLAVALLAEASLENGRGRLLESRKATETALAIRDRRMPGTLAAAEAHMHLGSVIEELGDLEAGKTHLLQAADIQKRLAPGSEALAKTYNDLGGIAWKQGDLATTRDYLFKALMIYQERAPGSRGVAASYGNLGTVCDTQGDLPAAKEHFQHALELFERLSPDSKECGWMHNNLGLLATQMEDLTAARSHLEKALAILERFAPGSLDFARNLSNLGTVSLQQGDLSAAKGFLSRALAIRERQAPGTLDEAFSLSVMGKVALAQRAPATSRDYLLRAMAIKERLGPGSLDLAETLRDLARAEALAGKPEARLGYLVRAVNALELQRARAGGDFAKTTFSSANGGFYTDLIAACLDLRQPERALEALERSRGRALLEMVSTRTLDLGAGIPEDLRTRQKALEHQRKTLSDKLAKADAKTNPADIEAWRSELLMLPQREEALAGEIRKASPRLAALTYPQPLDFRSMAGALEPGTLLIAFAVAEQESYLFTLQGGKARLKALRLPFGEKALETRVKVFRERLGAKAALAPDADADAWRQAARELYATLLAPITREIAGCQRILLMPDGPLHLLPFEALLPAGAKGAQPLGLWRPISIAASMTVHAGLKADRPGPKHTISWMGFGDPLYPDPKSGSGQSQELRTRDFRLGPLPGTREEIQTIAALFGNRATSHLGAEATKTAVRNLKASTSYLHFACHGLLDADFPMNSALALSPEGSLKAEGQSPQNGLLQAWEVMRDLKLESDCVVLSACETGVGKIFGGEGILGLTRAFFYAGARSAVVSLWPISDESTSLFMETFYQKVLAGASRDVALQCARKRLARSRDFAHPFHWAAFELHGRP